MTQTNIYVCVCVYVFIFIHACVCIYIYIYVYFFKKYADGPKWMGKEWNIHKQINVYKKFVLAEIVINIG